MIEAQSRTLDVWVALPERVLLLDIAGPMEVLRRANVEQSAVQFKVHYVGSSVRAMSSVGIPLADIAPLPAVLPEKAMIIVPGSADKVAFAEDVSQAPCWPLEQDSWTAIRAPRITPNAASWPRWRRRRRSWTTACSSSTVNGIPAPALPRDWT
jgi:hypothetical protein